MSRWLAASGPLAVFVALALALSGPATHVAAAPPLPVERGTQAVTGDPLAPGSTAVVRADGDCLRLRALPSLSGQQITCIPEGSAVAVLTGLQQADGYRWQLINWREKVGWAADIYLEASTLPAETAACQPAAYRAGFTGSLPVAQGGLGLVMWGGGTVNGVDNTAQAQGCHLTGIWTFHEGKVVGYHFGVPDFVNTEWKALFPDGDVPPGTSLLVRCQPPGTEEASYAVVATPPAQPPPTRAAAAVAAPQVSALAAIVIDDASGAVLYENNAHTPLPPASLTKIATAIVAIEGANESDWVPVTVDSRKMYGSSVMGLVPGDCFTLHDLLRGLILPSGNDAALAIADYVGGSEQAFVHEMNTLVARLGLAETHFSDPHGLGDDQHLASAYDLAMLSRYAMRTLPEFRDIVSTASFTARGSRDLSMFNVNSFLRSYRFADGVKTGFTEEAGRTLVASATRDGHRVQVVVLNAQDRFQDAASLLDWVWDNYTWN